MTQPKFKPGDLVVHKAGVRLSGNKPCVLLVLESITRTCYAGTQHHYECRAVWGDNVARDPAVFSEIELDSAEGWTHFSKVGD